MQKFYMKRIAFAEWFLFPTLIYYLFWNTIDTFNVLRFSIYENHFSIL